jgi:tetratricopeptide (TPR) repeat protein
MNLRFNPRPLGAALALAIGAATITVPAQAAPIDDTVAELQREWETIAYKLPPAQRSDRYEALATRAHQASAAHPGRAEPLIWEGIVVSSWAGAKGGLGALSLAKQARGLYESALKIRPDALEGSALNSLGVLYYKVPAWPIGFGDKARAQDLLQQALAINPKGIDPNYFFGDFLVEAGRPQEAIPYLERALQAPPRAGRELADAGRRDEVRGLLDRVRAQAR